MLISGLIHMEIFTYLNLSNPQMMSSTKLRIHTDDKEKGRIWGRRLLGAVQKQYLNNTGQKCQPTFLLTQTQPTACDNQGALLPGKTEALRHCSPFDLHPALPSTGDLKTQQALSRGTLERFGKPILRSCHSWPVQLLPGNAALCLSTFDLTQIARTGSAPSKTNSQPS